MLFRYNYIAKSKLEESKIEERVFSRKLHLYTKGYCWLESRATIVAIVKIKMQHVLGNERIYRKWMSAKFWIEIEIFRKFEGTTHTQKYEKCIDIDFERVSIVCTLVQLTKIENVWFSPGGFSYAIQEKNSLPDEWIPMMHTCQAVNCVWPTWLLDLVPSSVCTHYM